MTATTISKHFNCCVKNIRIKSYRTRGSILDRKDLTLNL